MLTRKPVLMIHEIRPWMLELQGLEKYILTFDDGLYSQYYYRNHFDNIDTVKIYFVSAGCISDGTQSKGFPSCIDAHVKARTGNYEDYMTVDQVKELSTMNNTFIGGHSYNHTRIDKFNSLTDLYSHLKLDTAKMCEWFTKTLGYSTNKFCYPYNEDHEVYRSILKLNGFTEVYGSGRIPIETLQHT